eukprot:scaffold6180_cov21-Tisochrysis_lutea.AAC.5
MDLSLPAWCPIMQCSSLPGSLCRALAGAPSCNALHCLDPCAVHLQVLRPQSCKPCPLMAS